MKTQSPCDNDTESQKSTTTSGELSDTSGSQRNVFADPKPLGIFSFTVTTMVLSLINVHARSVTIPNIVIGLALTYGGLGQFIAGMWEFARGDTFCAVVFTSYSTFWFSYSIILIPWFNVQAAYGDNTEQFDAAMGHFMLCWFIFTVVMTVCTIRTSVALFGLFFNLAATFLILTIGFYNGENVNCMKAGGYLGLITSLFGWYNAASLMWNRSNTWINLPQGQFIWSENCDDCGNK